MIPLVSIGLGVMVGAGVIFGINGLLDTILFRRINVLGELTMAEAKAIDRRFNDGTIFIIGGTMALTWGAVVTIGGLLLSI